MEMTPEDEALMLNVVGIRIEEDANSEIDELTLLRFENERLRRIVLRLQQALHRAATTLVLANGNR